MNRFTERQLSQFTSVIRMGAAEASNAMSTWLERSITVEVEPVNQLPLSLAADQLGTPDETLCACLMNVTGLVNGQLFLAFDERSGLSLGETILHRCNSVDSWGELEISAAKETANIVGCAFLNSLSRSLIQIGSTDASTTDASTVETPGSGCIPSAPVFLRDYAASIMQSVLIDQACRSDSVVVIKSDLRIAELPLPFHFMFVPDAESLEKLSRLMP
jgi:chemotaxis protein CheC